MSASYQFIIDTGTIVADTSTILADVQAEFQAALGANIDLAASTPQGTLIAGEVIARTSVMKNNADLANVINPDLSYGVFLDAVCAFLGVQRGQNASTQANGVLLTGDGVNTVTISAASRVQTSNGDIFTLVTDATIVDGGTVRANFLSQQYGNIPVPAGALTIIDGVIGWGAATVDGSTSTVAGTLQLTDPQLKIARNQQLARQGVGSSGAIASAVSQVANVTSVNVVENNTAQTTNPACIAGAATDIDIANALYGAHQGGCPWDYGTAGEGVQVQAPNGVQVSDPVTGLPYYVKFNRPVMMDVYVDITVHQQSSVSSPVPAVQTAIMNYATGQEQGEPGLTVGANVSAFEMAGAVARQIPGMYVKACSVAAVPAGNPAPAPGAYVSEYLMSPWQQGQLAINNINVTPV
jgi:hypothetical protein